MTLLGRTPKHDNSVFLKKLFFSPLLDIVDIVDIVGPLTTSSNGYTHILTLQDDLGMFSAAFPISSTDANTVARTLVEKLSYYFGRYSKFRVK